MALTTSPVSTLGNKVTFEPSATPCCPKVPSCSCLQTYIYSDAGPTVRRKNLLLSKEQTYPISRYFKLLGHQFLKIINCRLRLHGQEKVAARGRADLDGNLRIWATPLGNGVNGRFSTVFHRYQTAIEHKQFQKRSLEHLNLRLCSEPCPTHHFQTHKIAQKKQ